MPLRIDEIFVFVGEDAEGEGVCAFQTDDGRWIPLVCADQARVDSCREMARIIKRASGKRIKLVRFSKRSFVEEI